MINFLNSYDYLLLLYYCYYLLKSNSIVAYNADSVTLYGSLYHYPADDHLPNAVNIITIRYLFLRTDND